MRCFKCFVLIIPAPSLKTTFKSDSFKNEGSLVKKPHTSLLEILCGSASAIVFTSSASNSADKGSLPGIR